GTNTYTGVTTINAGVVGISNSAALGASGTGQGTVVNSGGALLSTGGILTIPEPLTVSGDGVGGSGALGTTSGFGTWTGAITLAGDATVVSSGSTFFTLSGAIGLGSNALTLVNTFPASSTVSGVVSGSGNVVVRGNPVSFTAANTYTGSTTVEGGGALVLSGSGTLASTSYFINAGGTLKLDNSTTNNTNRLPDTATLTLNGGTFNVAGNNAASAASAETVGSVVVARGHSTFNSTKGTGTGATSTFTAGSLERDPGATVEFSGSNLGSASNRILFDAAPSTVGNNGGVLPYATLNNTTGTTPLPTYQPPNPPHA